MVLQDPIVIVGAARTPIGSFQGELKEATAPELGATAIRAALERSHIAAEAVEEVVFGLGVEWDAGPDARMDEHVITFPVVGRQPFQKG